MTYQIKQTLILLFFSLSFFITANVAFAQGVRFPVAELGNCANVSACRAYCDDQANRVQCTDFAKKKGLYKEEQNAKKADGQKILVKAKEILGCNSESACRAICEQESNRDKCSRFAKEAGIEGGVKRVGPGGCNSEESCRAYCDTHEEECQKFGGGPDGNQGPRDKNRPPKGSGGPVCTTRDECEAFCKNPANQEACKNVVISKDENKGPNPEEVKAQMGRLRQNIAQMPAESQECLKQALGGDTFAKIMAGEALSSPIDGGVMQSCFAKGVKEFEEKENLKKPKKVDDFGSESQPVQPTQTQEVKGVSIGRTFLNNLLDWLRIK